MSLPECKALATAATALPDSADNLTRLYQCGRALASEGERRLALPVYHATVEMASRRDDRPMLAQALVNLADVMCVLGDASGAEPLLWQSLAVSEKQDDKDGMANSYSGLGRLRNAQSRTQEAREFHLRSFQLWEQIDDALGMAIGMNNVGTIDREIGDYLSALDSLQKSLAALERLGDERRSTTVLDNIGLVYRHLGDYPTALLFTRRGLEIRERLNDRNGIAKSLDSLSVHYQAEGNYPAALQALQRSLALRIDVGNALGVAESLHNIALVYQALGNYAEAVDYLQRAIVANRVVNDDSLAAQIEMHLGELYLSRGDFNRALRALNESLTICQRGDLSLEAADTQSVLGRVYRLQGRTTMAGQFLNRALETYTTAGVRRGRAETLIELAEVDRQLGHLPRGRERALDAQQLAAAMELPEVEWRALTTLGRLEVAAHHPTEAGQAFDRAISIVEDLRSRMDVADEVRSQFFSERLAPYQERIDLDLRRGRVANAFEVAERSKARALLDVIGADRVPLTTAMSMDERTREVALRTSLTSLNVQIMTAVQSQNADQAHLTALKRTRDQQRLAYDDFQTALYAVHPELRIGRAAIAPIRSAEAGRLVADASAALLEFVSGPRRTSAFLITSSGIRAFELTVSTPQLEKDVDAWRRQLASRDLRASATAQKMFDEVLGPIREALGDKSVLTIVPDGVLWDLPFQALQPAPGLYLIERTAISYAPSLTVLRETMQVRPDAGLRGEVLAFGNPIAGPEVDRRRTSARMDGRLEPLPEAEVQARAVGTVYGPTSRVYVGAEAREDRWRAEAGGYRVLHLATHGVVDNASPLYSYVVLAPSAPASGDDGLVEAHEIMRMHLSADLVVLSACETARGRVAAGEGVIGLTWALFVAGSPATIVSQWKVESASSTQLMVAFHSKWKAGANGLSKARALQQATISLLRTPEYSHPFYWSPYVLVGDPR